MHLITIYLFISLYHSSTALSSPHYSTVSLFAFLRLSTIFISRVHFNFFQQQTKKYFFLSFKYFLFFFHRRYISSELFYATSNFVILRHRNRSLFQQLFIFFFLHFTESHSLLLVNNAALPSLQIIRAPEPFNVTIICCSFDNFFLYVS